MAGDTTTWEYRTFVPPRETTQKEADDPETEMNALGAEGWAFAGTIDYTGGGESRPSESVTVPISAGGVYILPVRRLRPRRRTRLSRTRFMPARFDFRDMRASEFAGRGGDR